jgi:hypothetical protein
MMYLAWRITINLFIKYFKNYIHNNLYFTRKGNQNGEKLIIKPAYNVGFI